MFRHSCNGASASRTCLVRNMIDLLGQCDRHVQERTVGLSAKCDADYGRRVAEGIGVPVLEEALEKR